MVGVMVGRRLGFTEDDAYSIALVGIPCGIVGARALFVIERWSDIVDDPVDIFRINEGGIAVYGAVIGGVLGGSIYCWLRKLPVRRMLDGASIGIILGLGIGRIGDIINGEHFAKLSDLPWAVRYTNINSPSALNHPIESCIRTSLAPDAAICSQHPAVGYELVACLLILGLLFAILRFSRRDGLTFFSFLFLYSIMRFGLSYLRLDSREIIAGLTTPQVTALFLIPFAVAGILYCWRQPSPEEGRPAAPRAAPAPAGGSGSG
jgi:phosphatidylglycerol:prolipoprotein diacylglycerol transferase